ncbi:VOC family protein [Streptomyces sp. NPDC002867]
MLSTAYVTGSPNWIDLGTPDLDAATFFYGRLFGWEFASAGPDAGGYGMFRLDGRTVAAGMTVPADRAPAGWSVYFQTPDLDATAEAVEGNGGTVVHAPMDVFDQGRMAVFMDPSGAGFSAWQPGRNKGLDVVGHPGTLCWLELYTPEPDSALAFYSTVLGWETSTMPLPDGSGDYTLIRPGGSDPEAAFAGAVPLTADPSEKDLSPFWLPYFEVSDCDAAVTTAQELGGEIRMPPTTMEGVGRFARLADPAGARFAVLRGVEQPG